jgi:hypothetical protein
LPNLNDKERDGIKVFHVWDTSGVASIIARYMDKKYKTKSTVIMRKIYDPYGLTPQRSLTNSKARIFMWKSMIMARNFDLIHLHDFDDIIPQLRSFFPKKPIILSYYGSKIRGQWEQRKQFWSKADKVLVSTPDLLDDAPENVIHVPCPIDTELFFSCGEHKEGTAFHFSYDADDLAERYAKNYSLNLTVHDRNKEPIPYSKMPEVLSCYEYYVDVKRVYGKLIKALSKTALEALACGTKVIKWDGEITPKLPPDHSPELVVDKIWEIYMDCI